MLAYSKIIDNINNAFKRNYHYLIEISVMITKSGLDAVLPIQKFIVQQKFPLIEQLKQMIRCVFGGRLSFIKITK
jgi:hypothetical protein